MICRFKFQTICQLSVRMLKSKHDFHLKFGAINQLSRMLSSKRYLSVVRANCEIRAVKCKAKSRSNNQLLVTMLTS